MVLILHAGFASTAVKWATQYRRSINKIHWGPAEVAWQFWKFANLLCVRLEQFHLILPASTSQDYTLQRTCQHTFGNWYSTWSLVSCRLGNTGEHSIPNHTIHMLWLFMKIYLTNLSQQVFSPSTLFSINFTHSGASDSCIPLTLQLSRIQPSCQASPGMHGGGGGVGSQSSPWADTVVPTRKFQCIKLYLLGHIIVHGSNYFSINILLTD